ncbi:hypothetical protein BK636_08730 [Pseudomonas chlororaphis]|nr:hypothetical protein BK636_08730 [Pseudomonas chlororaphis]
MSPGDCRGYLSQSGFSFLDNRSKRRFFVHCQISQNLTVDLDGRFFQAGDETAVGQTVDTSTSVDTSDPQSAELTFFLTTVAVGVLACLDYRLLGNTEYAGARAVVAFSKFQNFFVTFTGNDATLYTSHELLPLFLIQKLTKAQHALDFCHVRRMQQAATAQLTLTLGRHFGQDVALESVLVLDTVSSFQKPLSSTTFGFHLWHVRILRIQLINIIRRPAVPC